MYAPQEPPAVFSSALAFHVSAVALGFPSRAGTLPLNLCIHFPKLLSDALFFRRFLTVYLPLPCGQITVILLRRTCGFVEHSFERLHIGITGSFHNTVYSVQPIVNFVLHLFYLF